MPRDQRFCAYCPAGPDGHRPLDTEAHCLTECTVGAEARVGLYNSISSDLVGKCFVDQLKMLVCPTNPTDSKLVSRYLQHIFTTRDKIDQSGRVG